jgi:hypothetical protein
MPHEFTKLVEEPIHHAPFWLSVVSWVYHLLIFLTLMVGYWIGINTVGYVSPFTLWIMFAAGAFYAAVLCVIFWVNADFWRPIKTASLPEKTYKKWYGKYSSKIFVFSCLHAAVFLLSLIPFSLLVDLWLDHYYKGSPFPSTRVSMDLINSSTIAAYTRTWSEWGVAIVAEIIILGLHMLTAVLVWIYYLIYEKHMEESRSHQASNM